MRHVERVSFGLLDAACFLIDAVACAYKVRVRLLTAEATGRIAQAAGMEREIMLDWQRPASSAKQFPVKTRAEPPA